MIRGTNSYCKPVQTILLDDEDDEEVKVVSCNINKSQVKNNLRYQKLSEEIKLLTQLKNSLYLNSSKVPNDLNQFQALVKKLDVQYADRTIRSAYNRIKNKFMRSNPPICLVRPLEPNAVLPPSSADSSLTTTTPSSLESSIERLESSEKIHTDSENVEIVNCDKREILTSEKLSNRTNGSKKRKCEESPSKSLENKNLSKSVSEKSIENVEIDRVNCDKQEILTSEKLSNRTNGSKKRKCEESSSKSLENKNLSKSVSEKSNLTNRGGNTSKYISELNQLVKKKPEEVKPSKRRSKSDSSKLSVEKSHLGVKAKIVKTKQTLKNDIKKVSPKVKTNLSKDELLKFKKEQKTLKKIKLKQLEMEKMQKIHDRLVDVLIPLYHNPKKI